MKNLFRLALILPFTITLIFAIPIWNSVWADKPPDSQVQPDEQVSLISTNVDCLTVPAGAPATVSTTVRLIWAGKIDEAYLVLGVAGSEGGHSIDVNGQRIGAALAYADDLPCYVDSHLPALAPIQKIPVPPDILKQDENIITLTNDANINDDWTAVDMYLEIHGVVSGPPATALELENSSGAVSNPQVGALAAAITDTILLTSSYELAQGKVISQAISYQIPMSYDGSVAVPLVIGIHGYGGNGQGMRNFLAAEANERGWLLAAPDMHGRKTPNHGRNALAWVGAQHDIIDTVEYMVSEYNVDISRIYIVGESMGGQTTTVMAAKYPDIFAAAAEWWGFTDLADWYQDLVDRGDQDGSPGSVNNRLATIERETSGTPPPHFEYARRSAMSMPRNIRLMPLTIWHNQQDTLVPYYHSVDLTNAINNNWNPPTPVSLTLFDQTCGGNYPLTLPYNHCPHPDLDDLFDSLKDHSLSSQAPTYLPIRTDESKSYYWLNISQSGGDHWTEVESTYDSTSKTITVSISDTNQLSLGFNLGSTSIAGTAGILQQGLALSNTTYTVTVEAAGSYNYGQDYTGGYFTVSLTYTGQISLTISPVGPPDGGNGDTNRTYLPLILKNN